MAAPTSKCKRLKESLANGEPSIHGPVLVAQLRAIISAVTVGSSDA